MDLSKLLSSLLSNPEALKAVVGLVTDLVKSLEKKPAPPPVDKVTVPTPIPGRGVDTQFPDDYIPAPATTQARKVTRVRIKLERYQLNHERFPDAPNGGLVYVTPGMEDGSEAVCWASKLWFDLTAYDQFGKEFLRDAVEFLGLSYQTEHHVGPASVVGRGGQPGNPNPGYEMNETDAMGFGSTAWISSNGFLLQAKAHGEGTYDCWGKVAGVESNHITVKVS